MNKLHVVWRINFIINPDTDSDRYANVVICCGRCININHDDVVTVSRPIKKNVHCIFMLLSNFSWILFCQFITIIFFWSRYFYLVKIILLNILLFVHFIIII